MTVKNPFADMDDTPPPAPSQTFVCVEAPPGGALIHDLPIDSWLRDCLELDPELVSESLRKLPGQVAYWNARAAETQRAFQYAEQKRHQYRARRRMELRTTLAKATIEAVGDAIETDPVYADLQVECIEAEAAMARTQGIARAMDAKKAALMSLGGILRDELRTVDRFRGA